MKNKKVSKLDRLTHKAKLDSMQISHPSVFWLIIAIVSAIAEMVLPSFGVIFASLAALVVAVITLFTVLGLEIQVVIFALSLLLSIIFLRPRFLTRMKESKGVPSRTEALIGKFGIITVASDPISGTGRALIEGNDWAVKSESGLVVNTKILVVGSSGIILTVRKA